MLKASIAILVGKNDDSIEPLTFRPLLRIGVPFENPQSTLGIECKGDRLVDIRFGCNQFDRETFRHMHLLEGLVRYTGFIRWSDLVWNQRMEHRVKSRSRACIGGETWRRRSIVEPEVIEIQVSPSPRVLINESYADGSTLVFPQVDGDASHLFSIITRSFCDDFSFGSRGIVQDDFNAG